MSTKLVKVAKADNDYKIEILLDEKTKHKASIPVTFVKEFKDEWVTEEAKNKSFETDQLDKIITKTEKSWGELIRFKNAKENLKTYFIKIKDKPFAVKVGPIPDDVDSKVVEIDWTGLQWGNEIQKN